MAEPSEGARPEARPEASREESTAATSPLADVLPFPKVRPAAPATDDGPRLRDVLGEVLRQERRDQGRTLADVAEESAVSLPYLSEVERGRKEVSSDLLASICDALEIPLVEVLERSADRLRSTGVGGSGIQMLAA